MRSTWPTLISMPYLQSMCYVNSRRPSPLGWANRGPTAERRQKRYGKCNPWSHSVSVCKRSNASSSPPPFPACDFLTCLQLLHFNVKRAAGRGRVPCNLMTTCLHTGDTVVHVFGSSDGHTGSFRIPSCYQVPVMCRGTYW